MEIERLGENKIRCALTEDEIHDMGFSIDDIIANTEMTQQFMRVVLNLVEEQEDIDIENISPMVKAELLQDHSMSITFGGESEQNFKSLVDTVNHLMSQIEPNHLKAFCDMTQDEKKKRIDDFLKDLSEDAANGGNQSATNKPHVEKAEAYLDPDEELFSRSMPFGLEFMFLDEIIAFANLFRGMKRVPPNTLYKMFDRYFLLMDFEHFSKEELRPLAFAAVEYDNAHCSDILQITYVREHGKMIIESKALETLMEL